MLTALSQIDRKNTYLLWWNSRRDDIAPPTIAAKNFHLITTKKRNTLLNLRLALTQKPALDQLMLRAAGHPHDHVDILWLPDPRPVRVSPECRLVTTIHDRTAERYSHFFSRKTRIWHRLIQTREIALRSDHLLTPSAAIADEIGTAWDIAPEHITATPLGVRPSPKITAAEITAVRTKYHLPDSFVLALGTIEPRKNLPTLIRAFDRLKRESDLPHALVLAGAFDTKTFADPRLATADWLHTIGFVEEHDKAALFAAADCFAAPSVYEGFGLPVLEAMAAGLPIVASDIPAHREVAGGVAAYVPTDNVEAWDFALRRMLTLDAAERKSKSQAGIDRAKTFDWRETARKTLDAFERIAQK